MTSLAERLPVVRVPEYSIVPFMRHDMVHLGGWFNVPVRVAVDAQWVLHQEYAAGLFPAPVV